MATVNFCNDSSDVSSISGMAAKDLALVCDQGTDEFTMQYYDGSSWSQIALGGGTSPASLKHAEYRMSQAYGTDGGDATSGSWTTYPITNEDNDTIGIALDATNHQMGSVPAGKYEVFGLVIFSQNVASARIGLYDATNSELVADLLSTSFDGYSGYDYNFPCFISGRFELNDTADLEIRFIVSTTDTGDGLGNASNISALSEYFGKIELRQVEAY